MYSHILCLNHNTHLLCYRAIHKCLYSLTCVLYFLKTLSTVVINWGKRFSAKMDWALSCESWVECVRFSSTQLRAWWSLAQWCGDQLFEMVSRQSWASPPQFDDCRLSIGLRSGVFISSIGNIYCWYSLYCRYSHCRYYQAGYFFINRSNIVQWLVKKWERDWHCRFVDQFSTIAFSLPIAESFK